MAGFKALAARLAETAIGIVGDIAVDVNYTHVNGLPSYDAATNTVIKNTTNVIFKGVLTSRSANEYDFTKLEDNHLRIIVAANLINFVPAEQDTCIIEGRNYEVKRIRFVPSNPLYLINIQGV